MKGCEVSKGTVIGEACRQIPGTGQEACYFWREVEGESGETVEDLRPLIERISGCPFQQNTLDRIREKAQHNPEKPEGVS